LFLFTFLRAKKNRKFPRKLWKMSENQEDHVELYNVSIKLILATNWYYLLR
jgi:hypothetical protein